MIVFLLANPLEISIFRVIDAWSAPRLAVSDKDRERQHERSFQARGTENRNAKGQERMKKTLTAIALLAGAVTGFSQGQISMFDYGASFAIQVFTASSLAASTVSVYYGGYTVLEQQGNPPGYNIPSDFTPYTGTPLGAGYDIELLAGAVGTPLVSLTPVAGSIVSSWYTGSGAGYWKSSSLAAIPGITTTATVAIAAWDNEGGTITSLAAAQAAGDPWGISSTATTAELGYNIVVPPFLPPGVQSFSLGIATTPEPSTIALGVIGASAFLMRLRTRKIEWKGTCHRSLW